MLKDLTEILLEFLVKVLFFRKHNKKRFKSRSQFECLSYKHNEMKLA